jgi:hypothetical protein
MRIPFKQCPSPAKANRGRYVMHLALKHLPSPWMGEGAGGGEDRTFSPPSPPSPLAGEGVLPPYESLLGEGMSCSAGNVVKF